MHFELSMRFAADHPLQNTALRDFDLKAYMARLNTRPAFARTAADAAAGMAAFTAYVQAAKAAAAAQR